MSKSIIFLLILSVTSCFLAASLSVKALHMQDSNLRAQPGDTVLIISNQIKADRKEQFEQFIEEFWAIGWEAGIEDPALALSLETTRVMYPSSANDDGTFTYIFVMDPFQPGFDYNIPTLLKHLVDEPDADRLTSLFSESLASPQLQWMTLQSDLGLLKAAAEDTVWIIRYPVFEDKRQQFEQFAESFWDIGFDAQVQDRKIHEAFYRTRVLYPTQADEDGFYSYFIVMDPRIVGTDYNVLNMIQHFYPPDQVEYQHQLFEESLAGSFEEWTMLQKYAPVVELVVED